MRILNRDFDPGFFFEHFVKDMGIALDETHEQRENRGERRSDPGVRRYATRWRNAAPSSGKRNR